MFNSVFIDLYLDLRKLRLKAPKKLSVLRETMGKTIAWAIEQATEGEWTSKQIKAHLALI